MIKKAVGIDGCYVDPYIIDKKMTAVIDNLTKIKTQAMIEAEHTKATVNGKPLKRQYMKDVRELDKIDIILCDLEIANDKFYFYYEDGNPLPSSCCHIEVVTDEIAEANEKDFFNERPEGTYKVGESNSIYTRLNNEYCFRFL